MSAKTEGKTSRAKLHQSPVGHPCREVVSILLRPGAICEYKWPVAPGCIRASSQRLRAVTIDHRLRADGRADYFRAHLGFRDNFSRKSTPPFVSRIKFALLFFPIFNDAVCSVQGVLRFALPHFTASISFPLPLSFIPLAIGRRERNERDERRRWGCERIDIGSFRAGRHEALFASSQSNEWIIFPNR